MCKPVTRLLNREQEREGTGDAHWGLSGSLNMARISVNILLRGFIISMPPIPATARHVFSSQGYPLALHRCSTSMGPPPATAEHVVTTEEYPLTLYHCNITR